MTRRPIITIHCPLQVEQLTRIVDVIAPTWPGGVYIEPGPAGGLEIVHLDELPAAQPQADQPTATRHICSRCQAELPTPEQLRKHIYNHNRPARTTGTGPFECPECGRTFTTAMGLGGHKGKAHGTRKNTAPPGQQTPPAATGNGIFGSPIACIDCDRHFATEAGLARHRADSHDKHRDTVAGPIEGTPRRDGETHDEWEQRLRTQAAAAL